MIITDENNNENANELTTRESFNCQNGHDKLTGQCENTPFHLLSSYCRAIIQYQFKSLTNFEIGVGGGREIHGGGIAPCPPPLWLRPCFYIPPSQPGGGAKILSGGSVPSDPTLVTALIVLSKLK